MDDARDGESLNSPQRLHLLTSCQYADKLLSEVEAVLAAAQSKSPFPKFKADLSPAQIKVVQDYVARMRSQLVRVLDGQSVPIPEPAIGSVHSIRVTLGFIDIAFEECRPKRMAGYGEIAPAAATALAGLVNEMQGIIARLDAYLAQGQSADLEARLRWLEEAGGDIAVVKALERAISRHGLVEFRPALSTAIERLEGQTFEIAVFGRVSCGKSSLLNYIAGQDVLPVGVNPITAVPTRLAYGAEPRATAWFAGRKPERFGLDRLAELVTEEHNPANARHVTRIVVELPAPRLREGIVYVDTPGLGSLATAGAAETKAYLPRCDLGVVLIDAGSTLTQDDLATIQTLYEAGTPASVLLSKADVLAPEDRERARQYVADHIRSGLGLELPVHAASIETGHTNLLEKWLDAEILPLYDRHAELARQSLNRKICALRLGVEATLKARLRRGPSGRPAIEADSTRLREVEAELRTAAGKIAETRTQCIDMSDELRGWAGLIIGTAASNVIDTWASGAGSGAAGALMKAKLEHAAVEKAVPIVSAIKEAAFFAGHVLAKTAKELKVEDKPEPDELFDVIKNMPRFDLGNVGIEAAPSAVASMLGRQWAVRRLERRVRSQAGAQIEEAVGTYARVVQAWLRKTFAELQERFDSYADAYRAHVARLLADTAAGVQNEQAVRDDLAALSAAAPGEAAGREVPGAVA